MCGIVGYIGSKNAVDVLLEGLSRLEYRGYDSAGVAIMHDAKIEVRRAVGRLQNLADTLSTSPITGNLGIGHTRWATHGAPSERNSHPHTSFDGQLSIIHNGIIENYKSLKEPLVAEGIEFKSDTDTEVVAHLIARAYDGDLLKAVQSVASQLQGAFALAVCHQDSPNEIICTRAGSPLIIGTGEGENFIASDVPAILKYTRDIIYLDEGQFARLTTEGVEVFDAELTKLDVEATQTDLTIESAEKEGYDTFMLKEVYEQPKALKAILTGRVSADDIDLAELDIDASFMSGIKQVVLLACGTSLYSAMIGKYLLERFAGITTQAWSASEFRYADPVVGPDTLCIAISQSGETADTLEALRIVKKAGARSIALCNVMGGSIPRACDTTLYTRAGPEIGVASTKAYTNQVAGFVMLAAYLGKLNGHCDAAEVSRLAKALHGVPTQVKSLLENDIVAVKRCAKRYADVFNFMYIGRHYNYPTAMEGALKLKELSYIHAEGYASGEMKHGPLALVEGTFPTIAIAPEGRTREKVLSNVQEIKARKGVVVMISTEGDKDARELADYLIEIPKCEEEVSPILAVVPLQLLAYYTATQLGRDVDKPRNLAKSVTVE
ncbi:glutamine--fructose-6-phosphate transaminase (isomerizing) [Planctomycetota bacterium]|nr:glutamine--fructose-6-phosphate transaminase (isomerizing) [Planctomycetota bacterium]